MKTGLFLCPRRGAAEEAEFFIGILYDNYNIFIILYYLKTILYSPLFTGIPVLSHAISAICQSVPLHAH